MRKFLIKILKNFILIYSILFLFQFTIDSIIDTTNICDNTWNKVFNGKIDSEIVVFGNSRAEAHYNTEIIENLTKYSSYNLGVSGSPINILKIRWKSFLNNNKLPKLLIIDVGFNLLGTSNTLYEKFQYLPYTSKKEYQEVAKDIDEDYYYESVVPMYKYRGYEMQIFNKLWAIGDTIKCINIYKGFKSQNKPWDEGNWTIFSKRILKEKQENNDFRAYYNKGIKELTEIVLFCKTNKIEVCLVWSPQYYKMYDYKKEQRIYLDSIFSSIAENNKLVYINFFNDSIGYNKTNFYDKSHLNLHGANKFSEKISDTLNNIFFNK